MEKKCILAMVCVVVLSLLACNSSYAAEVVLQTANYNNYTCVTGNTYILVGEPTMTGDFFRVEPGAVIDFYGAWEYHSMTVTADVTNINYNDDVNADPENPPQLIHIGRTLIFAGGRVYIGKSEFDIPAADVVLQFNGCPKFVLENSVFDPGEGFSVVGIEINGGGTVERSSISGCSIHTWWGIKIDGDANGPKCDITNNTIFGEVEGITVTDLQFGADANNYGMNISSNHIYGVSTVDDGFGIAVYDDNFPNNGLVIANNTINIQEVGIRLADNTANGNNINAHIYNNAIFDCAVGINGDVDDANNDLHDGLQLRNNIVWECPTTGVNLNFLANSDYNDIYFVNNVIGECEIGLHLSEDPGQSIVSYNAFDGNGEEINYTAGWDNNRLNLNTCPIDGFNGTVTFVNENPSSAGWDFHIYMNNVTLNPTNYHCDLAWPRGLAGGDNDNGTWMDPSWTDPVRHRSFAGSEPDLGIYGGPFSRKNIDLSMAVQDDPIMVEDPDIVRTTQLPIDYYVIEPFPQHLAINANEIFHLQAGTFVDFGTNIIDVSGTVEFDGGQDEEDQITVAFSGVGHFNYTSLTATANCYHNYTNFVGGAYGAYLNGVTATTARLPFSYCTFIDCGIGVYANNSRLAMSNCSISGSNATSSYGRGIYLENCAAGKVLIDHCTIDNNGTDGTVNSSGIFLSSSSPEIIWTEVKDNSGGGIYCSASSPDLNTFNGVSDQPNTIESNGGTGQGGTTADGSEIYLTSNSVPNINYNNIVDGLTTPYGYLIYKTNYSGLVDATNNWWNGNKPQNSWFNWNGGGAITYTPYVSGTVRLSDVEEFEYAMSLWESGDYAEAADHFENCLADEGSIGINSVHYLAGCIAMMENGDYDALRATFQAAAAEHTDPAVAKTALRFATDCLTQQGLYEDAMDEYDARRANAACLEDSILAVVDYLSVYELVHGGVLDAAMGDIPSKMSQLLAGLEGSQNGKGGALPTEIALMGCYPNPFNGITTINFALPQTGNVKLGVYDMAGREVTRLAEGRWEAGTHRVSWQADGVPTGVYLVRLESAGAVQSMKATLVK